MTDSPSHILNCRLYFTKTLKLINTPRRFLGAYVAVYSPWDEPAEGTSRARLASYVISAAPRLPCHVSVEAFRRILTCATLKVAMFNIYSETLN